jgi:hypothetical protein
MRWLLPCLVACAASKPPIPHRTGAVDDFAYFAGGWTTLQHRRVDGKWEDFPGTLCAKPYMGTMITVDELVFPTKGWAGLTLRTFDLKAKQWSVYWISSKTGVMGTPVVGGFAGQVGELYGHEDGQLIRYLWTKIDADHARWEQATSKDGKVWDTNWTADFTRGDAAQVCDAGRPRT